MDVDRAVGFDGGGLAAEGHDFAEDADSLVRKIFQVCCVDTRGGFGGHFMEDV